MKIAHLILAHKQPEQIARMIQALRHQDFDFYIHVDKKTDLHSFDLLKNKPSVYFIKNRIPVFWAEFSQVSAILNSLEEILLQNKYDYINLISGQDFPIKSAAYIRNYYAANKGTEFIDCPTYNTQEAWWKNAQSRFLKYNLHTWRIPGKYRIQNLLNRFLPERSLPYNLHIAGKSTWFSITANSAAYILNYTKTHPGLKRFFKYVWGADEFYFATILYNSTFRNAIKANLVYTDWSEGKANPKILTTDDFEHLQSSPKLYARKFDEKKDDTVLKLLEDFLNTEMPPAFSKDLN